MEDERAHPFRDELEDLDSDEDWFDLLPDNDEDEADVVVFETEEGEMILKYYKDQDAEEEEEEEELEPPQKE